MLNFLGGAKVDHPMADARKAKEIIDELPADPLKALADIPQWLESLRETAGFRADRLFENIDLLGGAAKNHQRRIAQDYFATSRQQQFQENRLWTCSYGFWKALSDAYLECVTRFENTQTGGTAFRKNQQVIVAVYERAQAAGSPRVYWLTQEGNVVARRLYDRVAERSGFIQYRRQFPV